MCLKNLRRFKSALLPICGWQLAPEGMRFCLMFDDSLAEKVKNEGVPLLQVETVVAQSPNIGQAL
jgi:hypothetical protein